MTKETTNSKIKPAQQFRLRGISVSIFANKVKERTTPFYKVSMQKTYNDGSDFRTTQSLGRDDLPIAELLLKKAWVWILSQETEDRKKKSDDEKEGGE